MALVQHLHAELLEDYENVLKSEPHNDAARRALAEIPQLMKAHEEQQKAEALGITLSSPHRFKLMHA